MKILIPMAGSGQRFVDAGYDKPKPMIDVLGRTMIQRVVENLGGPSAGDFVYVVRREHCDQHDLDKHLLDVTPGATIWYADGVTAGAACTALIARASIDSPEMLVVANCDQLVEVRDGLHIERRQKYGGTIYTFEASNPKWSYAAVDDEGFVWGVAEKQPISRRATCGIYSWRHGADFVRCAEKMIARNARVNNEFYIAPVYNEFIAEGHGVVEQPVVRMHGLGTPEDLQVYMRWQHDQEDIGGSASSNTSLA